MAAENRVGAFITAHDHELAALRLPREGMTVERYEAKLAEMDVELDWLAERAVPVNFEGAKFSGRMVRFGGAQFSGGTVDFSYVDEWAHPPQFDWGTECHRRG